jgi:predicted aconitase
MVALDSEERALLGGAAGDGAAAAMRMLLDVARAMGAKRLRRITRAHVDSCLFHGTSSLDFARRLVDGGARVRVPTTLNVGLVDRSDPCGPGSADAVELMRLYAQLGCDESFTCAPYQLPARPGLGEQIAWGESNAIVFANSVLGARTNRYGDFTDICAAITGRVPDVGLHRDENRRASLVFDVRPLPAALMGHELLAPLLGYVIGRAAGDWVPAIVGLPATFGEDDLRSLGAAAASAGEVAMFHAVGLTPEADPLEQALGETHALETIEVGSETLEAALAALDTSEATGLDGVCLGTPHASPRELNRLAERLEGQRVDPALRCIVSTSGWAARAAADAVDALSGAGFRVLRDTCSYLDGRYLARRGTYLTNSAKWAYYAPANTGVKVLLGTLDDCVKSAVSGGIIRTPLPA